MARTPYYASLVMARKREEEKNKKEPVIEQVPIISDEIKLSDTESTIGSEKVEETIKPVETSDQAIETPVQETSEPVVQEPTIVKPQIKKKIKKEDSDEK